MCLRCRNNAIAESSFSPISIVGSSNLTSYVLIMSNEQVTMDDQDIREN